MGYLPLANILHHPLRSLLSAMGIGIGICMLVTLTGLSRGSLYEIADRWESVDADLIVFPRGWGDSATAKSGVGLSEKYADILREKHGAIVAQAVPVFTNRETPVATMASSRSVPNKILPSIIGRMSLS